MALDFFLTTEGGLLILNFEVYCDESRQDISSNSTGKNMLIGGIWIPADMRQRIKNGIKALKEKHEIGGELKWNKIAQKNHRLYTDIIDYYFSEKDIRFRCIVIEKAKLDFQKFHGNDKELGFYKFYYQMLQKWLFDNNNYSIFTDLKTNRIKGRIGKLQEILEKGNLFSMVNVQAIPSDQSLLIQLTDIILGAVSAKVNPETKINCYKQAIIDQIELNIKGPIAATYPSEKKLNIFVINLQEGGW